METSSLETTVGCHVVAIPFPGRGHVNPMMNFCKLIATARPTNTIITFIVTQEWHGFLCSEPKPPNFRFATIPNVIPSEIGRARNWSEFFRATLTELEAPVEQLLDRLELPKPNIIIHDTFLKWAVGVGNRRNIPLASFWTQSATVFSIFHHFALVVQNGHFNANLKARCQICKTGEFVVSNNLPYSAQEKGNHRVDYIPGVPAIRVADLPTPLTGKGQEVWSDCWEAISLVSKSQYLLFTSTYELEAQAIDALGKYFTFPVYSIGPTIPHFIFRDKNKESFSNTDQESRPAEYLKWLDAQPKSSVLYISQGSFLSASKAQLDEIVAGVYDSGVRFFWVARDDTNQFERTGNTNIGIVVPWCDQLKVLSHPCIGGFWSHCGWNSTKEAVFNGIPMLAFPLFWDQTTNSKKIVEDWKTGWRVKEELDDEKLMTRVEIAGLLRKFMDLGSDEGKEIRKRAEELQMICQRATEEGGSSKTAIDAFLDGVSANKPR